jgi:hypothetical protein
MIAPHKKAKEIFNGKESKIMESAKMRKPQQVLQ